MSTSPVPSVLTLIHLAMILPCIVMGAYLLLATKGNTLHRYLGRIYMSLMFSTAILTLFIPAQVGAMVLHRLLSCEGQKTSESYELQITSYELISTSNTSGSCPYT